MNLDVEMATEMVRLQQENKQLKERIQNILEGKEIPAICAKKYEEYEEQLAIREKQIRKQICDEIKEKAEYKNWSKAVPFVYVIKPELLDQIEQAKEA